MVKKGRQRCLRGEEHPSCKITEETAKMILNSKLTYKDTAIKYGVSIHSVSSIKNKRMWKDL